MKLKMPTTEWSKHEGPAFGVELTWRHVGPGFGIGFGNWDFWVGWPSAARASCPDHSECEVPKVKVHSQP